MVISINKKVADLGAIPVTIQECSKHFFSKEFLKTEQIATISGKFSKMNSQRISEVLESSIKNNHSWHLLLQSLQWKHQTNV